MGAGGTGGTSESDGSNSVFSTITSDGGARGRGSFVSGGEPGFDGGCGSGGAGRNNNAGGSGTANQGFGW